MLPTNFNWSFSKLMAYEACPMRVKLKYIERLPELPPKADSPLERGSRVHERYEKFIKGEGPMDTEAKASADFDELMERLALLYKHGMATAEDDWLFDRDWNVCSRNDVWLWAKLDASVTDEENGTVIAIDFKTGKSLYKKIEHIQQVQLYAAVSALKYEWAETIHAELWYVDEGHTLCATFTQEEALKFVGRFDQRAQRMYDDKVFRPNPNVITCKWCAYGPKNGTGACPVGV